MHDCSQSMIWTSARITIVWTETTYFKPNHNWVDGSYMSPVWINELKVVERFKEEATSLDQIWDADRLDGEKVNSEEPIFQNITIHQADSKQN